MNAIVTGAAGFIGSHLVEELLKLNFNVLGIDNLSVGRLENLEFIDSNSFRFLEADVSSIQAADIPMKMNDVTYIFHLAALADIVPSVVQPATYFRSNVQGTLNMLEIARGTELKKFLYAASSSCYGIPINYPTPESARISPQYPYALTKYLGEELTLHWGKVYQVPVISLRLFNVFGPRARTSGSYGAVFGVFLAQKVAKKPFTVVGDGSQTRDFTFVTDVVGAFLSAAQCELKQEIFNVGSGGTYAINHLVELLGGDIEYIPMRPGEPDCTFADISKIRQLLAWEPKISFEIGVQKMLSEIESWAKAPVWTSENISKETESWFRYLGQVDKGKNAK